MKTTTKSNKSSGRRATTLRSAVAASPNGRSLAADNGTPAPLRIRSILVPIDFSPASIKAMKYAAAFAAQFGAKLTLLNVIAPTGSPDFIASYPLAIENERLEKLSEDQLSGLADRYELEDGVVEKTLVRTGVPFNEITSAARTLKVDLIIIATSGNTGLKHLLMGSTAERVVRHATCPVFVVRERERDIVA